MIKKEIKEFIIENIIRGIIMIIVFLVILLLLYLILPRLIFRNPDYRKSNKEEKLMYEVSLENFEKNREEYEFMLNYMIENDIEASYSGLYTGGQYLNYLEFKYFSIKNKEKKTVCYQDCNIFEEKFRKNMVKMKLKTIYRSFEYKNVVFFEKDYTDNFRHKMMYIYDKNWGNNYPMVKNNPGYEFRKGYFVIDKNWFIKDINTNE